MTGLGILRVVKNTGGVVQHAVQRTYDVIGFSAVP